MNNDIVAVLEHEADTLIRTLDDHAVAARLFDGSIDQTGYVHYLSQTYHYVLWTSPLLAMAGARLREAGAHAELAELLLQKAEEERGHERWVLDDLFALGCAAASVEATPPCAAVQSYVTWNRLTTALGAPTAFLGTAYVLERLATARAGAASANLCKRSEIPMIGCAVKFLRAHGAADVHHVSELASVLRRLDDPAEMQAIMLSARVTREVYPGLFADDARRLDPKRWASAA